ncbi:hypothetical protein [Sarcina ventriculi]
MNIYINENILKDSRLKPQEVYLLLHLINLAHKNKSDNFSIGNRELMKETRFTNGSMLIKYIDSLVLNNYIERISGGGAGIKNVYKINENFIKVLD